MTEFKIIQEEIETIKQKYLRSAMDIISDYNNENKTKLITNAARYMNCSKMQMIAILKNFRKYLFAWS